MPSSNRFNFSGSPHFMLCGTMVQSDMLYTAQLMMLFSHLIIVFQQHAYLPTFPPLWVSAVFFCILLLNANFILLLSFNFKFVQDCSVSILYFHGIYPIPLYIHVYKLLVLSSNSFCVPRISAPYCSVLVNSQNLHHDTSEKFTGVLIFPLTSISVL